jgi:hypothetical protein
MVDQIRRHEDPRGENRPMATGSPIEDVDFKTRRLRMRLWSGAVRKTTAVNPWVRFGKRYDGLSAEERQ